MKGFLAYWKFLLEHRLVIIIELQQNATKEVKSIYITNSSFSCILSIKQDCIGMATNSQTSKCKVLHENGSIPLSITVCIHICPYLYLFCATVWWCRTILIVSKQILTGQNVGKTTHYCKKVFEHFWREINNFNMGCTIMEKLPSQTLLDYSILSSAVHRELSGIIIVCTPPPHPFLPLTQFSKRGAWQHLSF